MNPNPPIWEMNVAVDANNSDSDGMCRNRELLGLGGYVGYVEKVRGDVQSVGEEYLFTVTAVK